MAMAAMKIIRRIFFSIVAPEVVIFGRHYHDYQPDFYNTRLLLLCKKGGEFFSRMRTFFTDLKQRLFQPVDIASLAIFRILLGAIIFWEVVRYFDHDWIRLHYIVRKFYFKYFGFEWVAPWPGEWMYVHFVVIAVLALCVMVGLFYRLSSALLFLAFTYVFLLDQTRYLNHLYLTCLILFLMALIPAHRAKSVDVLMRPGLRSSTVPTWTLWLLRAQLAIVFVYGGVAKINRDWLRGEPIRGWLDSRSDYPLIGGLLGTDWAPYFFAYGGLLFDLLVVPLFFWRRTWLLALLMSLFFHLSNKVLFDIGIFPILMLAATTLLFPPDWPRRVLLLFGPKTAAQTPAEPNLEPPSKFRRRFVLAFLFVFLGLQLLVPLRHHVYPGDVNWTEEGHRFSWRMKLRTKRADAVFTATDPASGKSWQLDNRDYLSTTQNEKVGRNPDMVIQFAQFMADRLEEEGVDGVEIRAEVDASLNGRARRPFIDPATDLAAERRSLWPPADWILPMEDLPLPVRD